MKKRITTHRELEVYQRAFAAAMKIYELAQHFPKAEKYSLADQMQRSSRSICAQIAEAWRRRRYEAAFINKLNEAEGEAAETQVWIEFAVHCQYMQKEAGRKLYSTYNQILRTLVGMIGHPRSWILPVKRG